MRFTEEECILIAHVFEHHLTNHTRFSVSEIGTQTIINHYTFCDPRGLFFVSFSLKFLGECVVLSEQTFDTVFVSWVCRLDAMTTVDEIGVVLGRYLVRYLTSIGFIAIPEERVDWVKEGF